MYRHLFEKWLNNQDLTDVTKNNYLRGIRYIKRDFAEFIGNLGVESIYEINDPKVVDILLSDEKFIAYDKKGNRMCSSALKKYKEFLGSLEYIRGISEENFRKWLKKKTQLTNKTIGSYISAIRGLSEPLKHYSIEGTSLNIFQIHDLNKLDEIMQDEKFKELDKRWNQAHTAALNYYKRYLEDTIFSENKERDAAEMENVVLIKINKSYKEGMSPEELYHATSYSWVASFEKTGTRDIEYYCSIYKNKIIEVYTFIGYEEEMPKREPSRYILRGEIAPEEIRQKLIGLDVSTIHKGSGNPIKYTNLDSLLNNGEEFIKIDTKIDIKDLPTHIHSYLTSKGFLYSKENIANLYLSLRSKPFVIISGISGTGKTKIVQLFAEAVGATEENGQFKLISVRPDWSDSSDLLGYKNLQEQFVEGQLTEMVKRAHDRPQLPHFVVLDEMNLARVEYYLSEFLSIMESRRREDGQVVSSTLVTTDEGEFSLPNNLYIIGTVNMDETTHPFSKKVLDRANTIEFNEIHLNNFGIFEQEAEEVAPVRAGNEHFESKYLYLKEAYSENKELVQKISEQLVKMNEQLQTIYAQVGYRVRDEICFYMLHNEEMKLLSEGEAFDFCVMQKVLPRISGAETHVEKLLGSLYEQFAGEIYEEGKGVPATSSYPRSAGKVAEMLRRLHLNGFTSFWIS